MNKKERKEAAELARTLLERSQQAVDISDEYSDEALWNDIKLKARAFLQADALCVTDEEREQLKKRVETFSKYGPSMIKACSERYKKDVLEEDIKVRKAHEMNDAAKLYITDPNVAAAAINGIASLFGTVAPQITVQPRTNVNSSKEEVIADVTLKED